VTILVHELACDVKCIRIDKPTYLAFYAPHVVERRRIVWYWNHLLIDIVSIAANYILVIRNYKSFLHTGAIQHMKRLSCLSAEIMTFHSFTTLLTIK